MRFFKEIPSARPVAEAPSAPLPRTLGRQPHSALDGNLTDLCGVAQALGVSKRYVQTLIARKAIPVIRLGRRCTRFDLASVLAAVKKFEIHEIGR